MNELASYSVSRNELKLRASIFQEWWQNNLVLFKEIQILPSGLAMIGLAMERPQEFPREIAHCNYGSWSSGDKNDVS